MPSVTHRIMKGEYDHMKYMLNANIDQRRKMRYKVIAAILLTLIIAVTVPNGFQVVYAAPLEDCDLDGFDDATGVPVPWPGYDETKGDTPDGPAGSKLPSAAPVNTDSNGADPDQDSGSNSKPFKEITEITKSEAPADTTVKNSGKVSDGKPGKTNSEGSGKEVKAEDGKISSEGSGKTNNAEKNNTGKTQAPATDITIQAGPDNNDAKDTTAASITKEDIAEQEDSLISDDNEKTASGDEDEQIQADSLESIELDTVIHTKGTLEITEVSGSMIYAGSTVMISGTGFAGNIQNLELELQSEPRQLGVVQSSENGSFELKLDIPKDLEAGEHNIVVLYHGNEIIRQQIEVGPKAADSFIEAITVGFSKENNGLIPGLLILLGLFTSGIIVLAVNLLKRSNSKGTKVFPG